MHRVLALLPLLALAPSADARCALTGLEPVVIGEQASLPAGAGIVVGYVDSAARSSDRGDVAVQRTWRFRAGAQRSTPKIESLAPGLAVYRLPDGLDALILEDKSRKQLAKITRSKDRHVAPVAPRAKRVTLRSSPRGRRTSTNITVQLAGKVPDLAVALVMVDARGRALSWGKATPGATTAKVYAHAGCSILPNDTRRAAIGDRVTLFWVDRFGFRSPASRPIAVTDQ